MIISKFNKYVEKHGRITYIILGIIICFMFVIFVAPDGASTGCSSGNSANSVGTMFGKKIPARQFQELMKITDLASFFRYRTFLSPAGLSQAGEKYLRDETISRYRMLTTAKKEGLYKKVTKEEIAALIREMVAFKGENGQFDAAIFSAFKENFLTPRGYTAADFDEMIRQDLAIQKLAEKVTADVEITDEELDLEMATLTVRRCTIVPDVEKETYLDYGGVNWDYTTVGGNGSAIPWKPIKNAVVAAIPVNLGAASITDNDIQAFFDANKDSIYKDQKFEDVKSAIADMLKAQKARSTARAAASKFLASAIADKELNADKFAELAKNAGIKTFETGSFHYMTNIPGFKVPTPLLSNAIYKLDNINQLSNAVTENNTIYIAILKSQVPGARPEKLNEETLPEVADWCRRLHTGEWWNTLIGSLAKTVSTSESLLAVAEPRINDYDNDPHMSADRKRAEIRDYMNFIYTTFSKFYNPPQRAFTVATFPISSYETPDLVTEADLQKGYDARKAQYQKTEVKLAIVQLKDEAKANEAYAKLTDGADFAQLAKEYSEDLNTKNKEGVTGFLDVESLQQPVKDQISKMEINQISPVIKSDNEYCFFKLLEKKLPRSLDDVRDELKPIVSREIARQLAVKDATKLSKELQAAWTENGADIASKGMFLKEKAGAAQINDYPLIDASASIPQGPAADRVVRYEVFSMTNDKPFSDPVSGTDNIYVISLNQIVNASLIPLNQKSEESLAMYMRNTAVTRVHNRMSDVITKINKRLAAGTALDEAAEGYKFSQELETITLADLRKGINPSYTSNGIDLLLKLKSRTVHTPENKFVEVFTKPNTVIDPIKTDTTVTTLYIDKIDVKQDAEERESIKEQLLNQKRSQVLTQYIFNLTKESATETIWDEK